MSLLIFFSYSMVVNETENWLGRCNLSLKITDTRYLPKMLMYVDPGCKVHVSNSC